MKKNMGSADRIIRMLLAILIIGIYLGGVINGILTIILLIFAVIFIATSFMSFCPLYLPFGLNTLRKKENL